MTVSSQSLGAVGAIGARLGSAGCADPKPLCRLPEDMGLLHRIPEGGRNHFGVGLWLAWAIQADTGGGHRLRFVAIWCRELETKFSEV